MSMRLKLLRKKLGVTLGTLAGKTGLTKNHLPKVERELGTPSIATALRLARALNTQVKGLFSRKSDDVDNCSVVHRGQRKSLPSGDGGPAYTSLAQQIGARALLSFIVHPLHDFSHSTFRERLSKEFILVHEGQAKVDFINQRTIFERDDVLHLNVQKPHRIRSLGETQAELLMAIHSGE